MKSITLHIIQSDVEWGNPAQNLLRMKRKLDSLPDGPSIVIMPELWTCSYDYNSISNHALAAPQALAMMKSVCREKGMVIIGGSLPWLDQNGLLFNRCFIIDDSGRTVGSYDKTHLFPLLDEPSHFCRGERPFLFDIFGVTSSVAICYDIRFPEFIRSLALAGADFLFVPAEWPLKRLNHWDTLIRARAIENQVFVIGCNRCGSGGGDLYGGHSIVVAPDGQILGECSDGEDVIMTLEISPSFVEQSRKTIFFEKSRNPVLYTPVTAFH